MTLWRRAPLWFRLVASLVGLAALALVVSGVVGARLLRGYLVDRVDAQLESAAATLAAGPISQQEAEAQLPSPFHVSFYYPDGQVAGVWWSPLEDRSTSPTAPDTLTPDQARRRAGEPFTVDDVVHDGSWRAVALPIDGPQGAIGSVLVATNMHEVDATVDRLQHIAMLVGLAVLAGLALAGYWIVRTALRPLTRIEQTAAAITRGDLTRRVPDADPATEVGRVGRGLNTMLDQIEGAFEAREASEATALRSEARMRQFVADASHELRTPLTSIRGFAELYRQGAARDPAELDRLMRRIEDQAARMGLLVEDLLLLARLDTQRPLDRQPVDLLALAADAVNDARAVAPDRRIELVLGGDDGDPSTPPVVLGDDRRLRQVLANLVNNALTHTPAGRPIEVRVGASTLDGRPGAAVEVVDHGPGLAPEQAERVFERFYRADPARSPADGGTGLGLSIVAALVAVHGGTVAVDSVPGRGARFRVVLPLAPDAAG